MSQRNVMLACVSIICVFAIEAKAQAVSIPITEGTWEILNYVPAPRLDKVRDGKSVVYLARERIEEDYLGRQVVLGPGYAIVAADTCNAPLVTTRKVAPDKYLKEAAEVDSGLLGIVPEEGEINIVEIGCRGFQKNASQESPEFRYVLIDNGKRMFALYMDGYFLILQRAE